MLRLVHPAEDGQDPRRRKGRRASSLSLTADEVRHLKITIRNTARAYGGFPVLAGILGMAPKVLANAAHDKRRHLSPALALAVARAAGMSVEAVLSGALGEAGRCKACGARAGGERRAS